MSQLCCLPGCDNRARDGCSLFKVKNKKYCKTKAEQDWAEDLEKIIFYYRGDKHIKQLHDREMAKICENHFESTDIIISGKTKLLKIGSIPKKNLPKKSCVIPPKKEPRKPPVERLIDPKVYFKSFVSLKSAALPKHWTANSNDNVVAYRLFDGFDQPRLMVKVQNSFEVSVAYYGWLGLNHESFPSFQHSTLHRSLAEIEELSICDGLKGLDKSNGNDSNGCRHIRTKSHNSDPSIDRTILEVLCIRDKLCEIFIPKKDEQCRACISLDSRLKKNEWKRKNYEKNQVHNPLQRVQPQSLMSRVNTTFIQQKTRIEELQQKVKDLLAEKNKQVEVPDIAKDLYYIMENAKPDELTDFQKLFWTEQLRLNKTKKHGESYHPAIIRFCLSLATKSPICYEELRETGVLRLPSQTTLRDYRNANTSVEGIQEHVITEMLEEASNMKNHEKLLILSMDEIKIKENLVYSQSQDRIIGFGKLEGDSPTVASHVLQFYVRSLTSKFSRPFAFYPTKNITAGKMCSIFWDVVEGINQTGMDIIAFVCDGAATNRKLLNILNNKNLEYPYECINIHKPNIPIYLVSDPPHLLKTTCNNVRASSFSDKTTKLLKRNEQFILWEHFQKVPTLYKSNELRCSKLNNNHFSNKSFSKMRVVHAAQLLSNSVSQMMTARGGEQMKQSAWLAHTMNRWFDLMNTRYFPNKNPDLRPYTDLNDSRLSWLEDVFLVEINAWKSDCFKTSESKYEARQKFLSFQTYEGLIITTFAITKLVKFVLQNFPGIYVLTKRINQDPLEAYFGHMRQIGRKSEAPDVARYAQFENIIVCKKKIRSVQGSNVNFITSWKDKPISSPMIKRKRK